jgi:hypothetical protein
VLWQILVLEVEGVVSFTLEGQINFVQVEQVEQGL